MAEAVRDPEEFPKFDDLIPCCAAGWVTSSCYVCYFGIGINKNLVVDYIFFIISINYRRKLPIVWDVLVRALFVVLEANLFAANLVVQEMYYVLAHPPSVLV